VLIIEYIHTQNIVVFFKPVSQSDPYPFSLTPSAGQNSCAQYQLGIELADVWCRPYQKVVPSMSFHIDGIKHLSQR
jgi:hypothetical protein